MSIIGKLLDFFKLDKHNTNEEDVINSNQIKNENCIYTNTKKDYNPNAKYYKIDTLENIESIPIPSEKFEYNCDFTQSIEYVLQRKATQFKKEGRLDLAIACLKKAIDIMPFAPMPYPEVYDRLENYLKLAGRFDEARTTRSIHTNQAQIEKKTKINQIFTMNSFADMIKVLREGAVCNHCACYHDRIYTKNGLHGFPNMNIFINYYSNRKCDCYLSFHLYKYEHYTLIEPLNREILKYSNRPFVDDRTTAEIDIYEGRLLRLQTKNKDRQDYDWLCEHLPDKAPKSYGGYRNMKNQNSPNFQKLVLLAKEHGYEI